MRAYFQLAAIHHTNAKIKRFELSLNYLISALVPYNAVSKSNYLIVRYYLHKQQRKRNLS